MTTEISFDDLMASEKVEVIDGFAQTMPDFTQVGEENKKVEVIEMKDGQSFEDYVEKKKNEDDIEEPEKKKSPSKVAESIKSEQHNETEESFVSVFAKMQLEEGLISSLDEVELARIVEEEGEVAAIKYIGDLQRQTAFDEAKKMYSEDRNELEEYFRLKDAGVDPEVAKELIFNKSTFNNVTEDDIENDEELRRKILTQLYKQTTSFDDKKIKKEVDKTFAAGDDIEEAKEGVVEVRNHIAKKIEEEKSAVKDAEKNQRDFIAKERESFLELVKTTEEIFPGQKINKPMKDKIAKMVLDPAVKTQDGRVLNGIWAERAKDPKNFDFKLGYMLVSGQFYGNTEPVKKVVETELAKKMEKILSSKSTSIKGVKPSKAGLDEYNEYFSQEDQSRPMDFL